MKIELILNTGQRTELARIFRSMLREQKMYAIWGPELKGFYEQSIDWFFIPFKGSYTMFPPVECDQRDIKNDDGIVIDTVYKFRMDIVFPQIKQFKDRSIILEKELKKVFLDGIH